MADISKDELQKHIKEIVSGANLSSLTSRVVRTQLEEKLSADLLSRKKEIDELLMAEIEDANPSGSEEEEEQSEEEFEPEKAAPKKGKKKAAKGSDDSDGSASEDEYSPKAKKAPKKKPAAKRKKDSDDDSDDDWGKRKPKKVAGRKAGGAKQSAFTKSFKLSEELADVVGENIMPRHLVVKKLWAVIKERNLQDPKNKQYAICDDQLMKLFGIKRFRTFGMMKHLKDHFIEAA